MAKVTTFTEYLNSFRTEPVKLQTTTVASWDWYMSETKKVRSAAAAVSPKDIPNPFKTTVPKKITGTGLIGNMVMFQYDPKLKEKLPYYDRFPLGFPITLHSDGYTMLNLHYLDPRYRAKMMDALYGLVTSDKNSSRLAVSYKILCGASKFIYFKPCIKRYLYPHIRSTIIPIEPSNWDAALMLPLQQFVGAPLNTIHNESNKIITKAAKK